MNGNSFSQLKCYQCKLQTPVYLGIGAAFNDCTNLDFQFSSLFGFFFFTNDTKSPPFQHVESSEAQTSYHLLVFVAAAVSSSAIQISIFNFHHYSDFFSPFLSIKGIYNTKCHIFLHIFSSKVESSSCFSWYNKLFHHSPCTCEHHPLFTLPA